MDHIFSEFCRFRVVETVNSREQDEREHERMIFSILNKIRVDNPGDIPMPTDGKKKKR